MRRGRPAGFAKAPCSLAGSCLAMWLRMIRSSLEISTVSPTTLTWTWRPRIAFPTRYGVAAKLMFPDESTLRVTGPQRSLVEPGGLLVGAATQQVHQEHDAGGRGR